MALGDEEENYLTFYSSLNQQKDEQVRTKDQAAINSNMEEPDFSKSCWDLIRVGASDETAEIQSNEITDQEKRSLLILKMQS